MLTYLADAVYVVSCRGYFRAFRMHPLSMQVGLVCANERLIVIIECRVFPPVNLPLAKARHALKRLPLVPHDGYWKKKAVSGPISILGKRLFYSISPVQLGFDAVTVVILSVHDAVIVPTRVSEACPLLYMCSFFHPTGALSAEGKVPRQLQGTPGLPINRRH